MSDRVRVTAWEQLNPYRWISVVLLPNGRTRWIRVDVTLERHLDALTQRVAEARRPGNGERWRVCGGTKEMALGGGLLFVVLCGTRMLLRVVDDDLKGRGQWFCMVPCPQSVVVMGGADNEGEP